MGYDTSFDGQFRLDKPLKPAHKAYLQAFADTRRMARDEEKAALLKDELRVAAGLDIGAQGAYYVGAHVDDNFGQTHSPDIIDYNEPPQGQHGLWCEWEPVTCADGSDGIGWSGAEKFYYYTAWLEYLIEHFLAPWGYKLSGEVTWQGEDSDDSGTIYAKDNKVEAVADSRVKGKPSWA